MSAAAFEVGTLASVEVEWVWGVDEHTKLLLPPLCCCGGCGDINCLHKSEVFISLVRGRFGVTSGGGRKCRMEKWPCWIRAEDAGAVASDHCSETHINRQTESAEAALDADV